ncbi:MAG: hypothetical protein ACP8RL_08525 [cyanobacterium endosymbiont of Rhopalodia inflata]
MPSLSLDFLCTRFDFNSDKNLLAPDGAANDAFGIKLLECQLRQTFAKNEIKL